MSKRLATAVTSAMAIGLTSCGAQPTIIQPARDSVVAVQPSVSSVAERAATPVANEPSLLSCQGGSTPERPARAELVGSRAEQSVDGSLMVVLSAKHGDQVVGCASADTAKASLELSLSVGGVVPLADGIAVVIASPSSADLVSVPWLTAVGDAAVSNAGFTTRLFVVDASVDLSTIEGPPTVMQIAGAVVEVRKGTSATMGLGPDLLVGK